jgi:hypothetical protein
MASASSSFTVIPYLFFIKSISASLRVMRLIPRPFFIPKVALQELG